MNNIMQFENNDVEVIFINGKPYFEIYSTGKALGYYRWNGRRTHCTTQKDRIDIVIKNAEIQPLSYDEKSYFNEEQLFDFMLEAKTEKVKPFRKWVTSEVLPSINRTGKYEVENVNQTYLYNGEKVMTVKRFCSMLDLSDGSMVHYRLKSNSEFIENKDYKLLTGIELSEFKKKHSIRNSASSLLIIFKKGVGKLMLQMKLDSKENRKKAIEYFKEDKVAVYEQAKIEEFKPVDNMSAARLVKESKDIQKLIKCILKDLTTVETLVNAFDSYNTAKQFKVYQDAIYEMERGLSQKMLTLGSLNLMVNDCHITSLRKVTPEIKEKITTTLKIDKLRKKMTQEPLSALYVGEHNIQSAFLL